MPAIVFTVGQSRSSEQWCGVFIKRNANTVGLTQWWHKLFFNEYLNTFGLLNGW